LTYFIHEFIFQTTEKDRFLGDILEEQEDDQFHNDFKLDEPGGADNEEAEEDKELYDDCQDEESFTFVIDEEMIQFLQTSAKHKLELRE
jgi:hypothetical protein